MTEPIASPQPASRSRLGTRLAAFTPLWILIAVSVASPTYTSPMFTKPPDILGVPLGVVIGAVGLLWMLLGALVIWKARSSLGEALGLMLFTIPATLLVVFTPAVVLIVQNLG